MRYGKVNMQKELTEKQRELAKEALALSRDQILMEFRYFAPALTALRFTQKSGMEALATDGSRIFYDPQKVLELYRREPDALSRGLLHLLFHCLFHHDFEYDKRDTALWDLAADLAVEAVIEELKPEGASLKKEIQKKKWMERVRQEAGGLTAERIYRWLKKSPPDFDVMEEISGLFFVDSHGLWIRPQELLVSDRDWMKIRERLRAELKSFSRGGDNTEGLEENLDRAVRERYDYAQILAHFMTMGEQLTLNDEEFDLVYYTYGLHRYGNLPLLEPLEYREEKKIREFVIVIDTSASCRGELVRGFLRRTYSILKDSESFFRKINLHLIQCDHEVRSDTKITCDSDFEAFLKNGKLKGFGATDFRPAFSYVDELCGKGEFENLKGLIYFTDGFGIYPEIMPDYQVMFAFLKEEEEVSGIPPWAFKVVLTEEEVER